MKPMEHQPRVVIIAGPNGAGKSTFAHDILALPMSFLNADEIAKNLEGGATTANELRAGRLFLEQLNGLAQRRADFALETTLAYGRLAHRIEGLREDGYRFHLHFLWLPSPELAIARVAQRVREGGHSIPEATIRRRYEAGLRNLFRRYLPIADYWTVYKNLDLQPPVLIAEGGIGIEERINDLESWDQIRRYQ